MAGTNSGKFLCAALGCRGLGLGLQDARGENLTVSCLSHGYSSKFVASAPYFDARIPVP